MAGRPGCPRAAVIACALGASRASRAGQCLVVGEAALNDIEIAGVDEETSAVPVAAVGAGAATSRIPFLAAGAGAAIAADAAIAPSPAAGQIIGEVGVDDLDGTGGDVHAPADAVAADSCSPTFATGPWEVGLTELAGIAVAALAAGTTKAADATPGLVAIERALGEGDGSIGGLHAAADS